MTTKAFEKAFNHTVGVEGGYSDHPSDRGAAGQEAMAISCRVRAHLTR